MLQLFFGYISLMLFGTIWLCTKYLSDLADCKRDVSFIPEIPHQVDKATIDPWNVNDHPIPYVHSYSSKKKRGEPEPLETPVAVALSNGKSFIMCLQIFLINLGCCMISPIIVQQAPYLFKISSFILNCIVHSDLRITFCHYS